MALSIKTKIWLPAIAVSIGLVLMATAWRCTVKSQAITVKGAVRPAKQLELARWRGLAEAQALRTLGAALAADEASAALLQGGQEQDQQELAQVQRRWARCSPP